MIKYYYIKKQNFLTGNLYNNLLLNIILLEIFNILLKISRLVKIILKNISLKYIMEENIESNNLNKVKEEEKEHKIYQGLQKPDYTPETEKIQGPSHDSPYQDKVTQGIEEKEFSFNFLPKK
jgi:hypothetical protein